MLLISDKLTDEINRTIDLLTLFKRTGERIEYKRETFRMTTTYSFAIRDYIYKQVLKNTLTDATEVP